MTSDIAPQRSAAQAPAPAVACSHCQLPVPPGLVVPHEPLQFCCHGCRTVYEVIHGCGLDRFYRVRDALGVSTQPARTTPRKYSEFDDPSFRELYYQTLLDGSLAVEFYLEGVHCAACVWLVEKLPQVAAGVIESRLDLRRGLVRIRWEPDRIGLSQIARALDSLGYPPHPAKDARTRELRRSEDRRFLIRIGVAGACAGNVMTLSFALYGGVFTGIESGYANFFRLWSMAWGLLALLWPGSLFFRGAWAALRTGTAHLDLPIALGLLAGGLAGTVNALRCRGEIYFDSLTMLVLLLLAGRWLQRRQQCWTNDSLELLFSLTPTTARRLESAGGSETPVEVPIEAVRPGDRLEVLAGESIPADGRVVEGRSALNQALLTGESRPVSVAPGDAAHAGTVNLAARLVVQVEAVGEHTRVGRLMQLVEQHSRSRAPVVQMADRVAAYFVRIVIALAVLTLGLWLWRQPARAVDYAVAMLIVTCPCALGLATPLAVTIALGRAARRHILIKGGEALETLARSGTILLDKTGTITAGRSAVVSWRGDAAAQPLVAALERHSAHAIATALVAGLEPRVPPLSPGGRGVGGEGASGSSPGTTPPTDAPTVADVQQTLGGGIEGLVAGRQLMVGSPAFVRNRGAAVDAGMDAAQRETIAAGLTPVLVAVDGRCTAVVGVGDPVRDDVPAALAGLRRLGWQVRILSGDHPEVVAGLAARLGIAAADAIGGVSPEDKAEFVRAAVRRGPVVMVGDGVNDAAALAAATVGIAVHGGAEASLAAAQIYLDRPGLMPIVELIHAARSTLRAIGRSLTLSLCYNTVAAALTLAGLIGPLWAALLMPLSSFTVLTLAYTNRTFGDPR